ncbi:MAG: DUF3299 domain-containing protein [bacterium]|nr:DUF3299 domain-containing protein [bacterium]
MTDQTQQDVAERQFDQAIAEAGGGESPPDRLASILERAAVDSRESGRVGVRLGPAGGRLLAAAVLLLGLAATITVSVLENGGEPRVEEAGMAAAKALQDPQGEAQRGAIQKGPAVTAKPGTEPETSPENAGKELPKGTDPADLAAMRSAQAMLEAEKRLRKLIETGKIAGIDQVLPFQKISNWKYQDKLKGMPQRVRDLDGKRVLMLGFMLPIEEVENMREFLLVESLWACCYGQPPDINGLVRCVMPKGKAIDYNFEPMKVVGRFEIEAFELDGYCVDIYQLHVDYAEPIE